MDLGGARKAHPRALPLSYSGMRVTQRRGKASESSELRLGQCWLFVPSQREGVNGTSNA